MLVHNLVVTGSLTFPTALPISGSLLVSGSLNVGTNAPVAKLASYLFGGATASLGDNIVLGVGTDGGVVGTYTQIGIGYNNGNTGQYYPAIIGSVIENSTGQNTEAIIFATRPTATGTTRPIERMRISSSGSVGINTSPNLTTWSNAARGMEIYGSAGTYSMVKLNSADLGNFYLINGVSQYWIYGEGNYPMGFYTSGSQRMTITAAGNVGIGTTSPSAVLDVTSTTNTLGFRYSSPTTYTAIRLANTSAGLGRTYSIGSGNSGSVAGLGLYVYDETGGSTPFMISGSGNVGIGTTQPKASLQVSNNTSGTPAVPSLGQAGSYTSLYLSNLNYSYGMLMGSANDGSSWIQAQRTDGTATAYSLQLNPNGGTITTGAGISIHNGMTLDSNNYSSNITTSFVSIGPTTQFVALCYVYWADNSNAQRDYALLSMNYYPAGVTTISSSNNAGNGVVFQISGQALQMKTTSGTVTGTQVVWFKV